MLTPLAKATHRGSEATQASAPGNMERFKAAAQQTIAANQSPADRFHQVVMDVSERNKMKFLYTVNQVQKENRRDLLRRAQTERALRSSVQGRDSTTTAHAAANSILSVLGGRHSVTERTPLQGSMGEASVLTADSGGGDGSGDGDAAPSPDGEVTKFTVREGLREIILGKGVISLCLLAAPLAIISAYLHWSPTWVFWLNFTVMIPLAAILGDFTEELALHTNDTIGGLINASFGNAVEVVVGIQALLANEIRVVQASMIGSIFSNLLLVLGCCFFFGGIKHQEQKFNATAATANVGLLALSSIAMVLPTPFAAYYDLHDEEALIVSRVAAVFLIFMYAQLLYFQLKTHAEVFEGDDDDEELATLPFGVAVAGLLIVTLLVALFSEFLVGSIDGFTEASGISRTFVGMIILPIVGNAVEHVTAVTVAMKNKMDLAMGVAVGSCTQISLLVVPLTVIVGWCTGIDMTLNFPHFEIVLYVLSVFTVSVLVGYPTSNWLEGSLLITTYCLIACGFWFEKVQDYTGGEL